MARLLTSGAEFNSLTAGVEYQSISAAGVSIDTGTVRSGTYALKVTSTASTGQGIASSFVSAKSQGPYFARVYFNISALPGAAGATIAGFTNAATVGSTCICSAVVFSDSSIYIAYDDVSLGPTLLGGTFISTNTWYCLEIRFSNTGGAGHGIAEGRINGTVFTTSSTLSYADNVLALQVGSNLDVGSDNTSSGIYFFDDMAVNDTSGSFQTGYPGPGKVLRLKPNAAGDVNTFATQTGGTAGSANNFTRVDEVTPDDATTFNGSSTLNQEDLFNLDNSGTSSSDTINVVEIWGRHRNSTADAAETIKYEMKSGGVTSQSAGIIPNSTVWRTNAATSGTSTFNVPIVRYQDPSNVNWTNLTVDALQAGYKLTTIGTGSRRIDVTSVSAIVDYTPGSALSITKSDTVTTSESLSAIRSLAVVVSDIINSSENVVTSVPSEQLTVSDSTAISESLSRYSDFIEVMENLVVLSIQGDDTLTVSDTSTTSESLSLFLDPILLVVSDTISTTESLILITSQTDLQIGLSDGVATTESVREVIPFLLINVNDTATTSENSSTQIPISINRTETISWSDTVSLDIPINKAISNTITTSENISVIVQSANTITTSVSDNTSISESVIVTVDPLVQSATASNNNNSVTATFGSTPTQGNLLIGLIYTQIQSGSIPGWNLANGQNFGNGSSLRVYYKQAGASESTSVTAQSSNSPLMELIVLEYAFTGTTLDLTASTGDGGANVTTLSSGTTTATTMNPEIAIAAFGFGSNQGDNISWTNFFTFRSYTAHLAVAETTASAPVSLSTSTSWSTGVRAVGTISTFNAALTATVSDTATGSESISTSDELNPNIFDQIGVSDVVTVGGDLFVTVSDTAAISESFTVSLIAIEQVVVSDTSTISENIRITFDLEEINISDSITTTDVPSHYSDQIDVNESVSLNINTFGVLTISDTVTTSESIGYYSDLVIVGESVRIQTLFVEEIAIGDTITSSDSVSVIQSPSFIAIIEDDVIVSEFTDIIVFANTPTRFISLTDNRIIDENGSYVLDENGNYVLDETPGGDFVLSSESVQLFKSSDIAINTSDTISTFESVLVVEPLLFSVTAFDTTVVGENIQLQLTVFSISVSDTINISESILNTGSKIISAADTITVSETTIRALTPLFLVVQDSATVSENVVANIPSSVVTIKAPPIIILDNGHLALHLGGNFYQIL